MVGNFGKDFCHNKVIIRKVSGKKLNILHGVCMCVCSSPPWGGLDKYRDTFSKCPPLGHSPAGNGQRALGKSSKREGGGGELMLGLDVLAFGMGLACSLSIKGLRF